MIVLIGMLTGITDVVALLAVGERFHDLLRPGHGTDQPRPRGSHLDAVHLRLYCRRGALDRDRDPVRPFRTECRWGSRFRLRDLRFALRPLQRLRSEHVAHLPGPGPLAGSAVRGAGLRLPQPLRQDRSGLAGLRRRTSRLLTKQG